MAEKKEYLEFRSLLVSAMNGQSQKEFAKKSGLSYEHLNRMLNNQLIARPSQETLQKIINASYLVNAVELYKSCGYEPQGPILMNLAKMSLSEMMKMVANKLLDGFHMLIDDMKVWSSLDDAMRVYMYRYGWELKRIKMMSESMQKNQDVSHKGAYSVFCKAEWVKSNGLRTYHQGETYFLLYFMKLEHGEYLLTDIAVDGQTLSVYGQLPDYLLEMVYEDGEDIATFPYCSVTTEKCRVENPLLMKLQAAIFERSDEEDLFHTEFGVGAVYEGTPAGFVDYVVTNKQYFQKTAREVEMVEDLEDIKNGKSTLTPDEVVEDYFYDGTSGPAAVIVIIMFRKFSSGDDSKGDCVFEVNYGESTQYDEYLRPCIYVREDFYCCFSKVDKPRRDYIESCLKKEFQLLQMPTFGGVIVYNSCAIDVKEMLETQEPLVTD